jgi:CelD/BcsL family acetyltransferase involved in cellulose biosynthesis
MIPIQLDGSWSRPEQATVHGTIESATESAYEVEVRTLAELAAIEPEWRALAARALTPNIFYEPQFALAAAPVFGRNVDASLVWSRGRTARLVGLLPARIEQHRYGPTWPIMVGWINPYAPLGVPLIDRDAAEAVIGALLDHLASHKRSLLLPMFPQQGPLAAAFDAVLARRGGESVAFAPHQRALLAPTGERSSYLERALPHKKLKELGRQLRRLGEDGDIVWEIAREGAAVEAALADFLTLEAAGWKGRTGTAAAHDRAIRAFLEAAVPALARDGQAAIMRLLLVRQPIAALIVLRSGDTAWCWKIAYDEGHARASPGVQLMLHATRALLADQGLIQVDSCAAPDHPMIDHIWRERLALADRLVRPGPSGHATFAVMRTLETMRRGAIAAAKRGRDLLRR